MSFIYFFAWGFTPGYHSAFNCHVYLVSSHLWQFPSLSFFLTDTFKEFWPVTFWMSFNLGLFSIFSIFRVCIFDKNTTKMMFYHSQCIISEGTWCQCVIHGNDYWITWLRCLPVLSNEYCDFVFKGGKYPHHMHTNFSIHDFDCNSQVSNGDFSISITLILNFNLNI